MCCKISMSYIHVHRNSTHAPVKIKTFKYSRKNLIIPYHCKIATGVILPDNCQKPLLNQSC